MRMYFRVGDFYRDDGSANAELKFVALGADNNLGLRIDDIKLVGDK